MYQLYSGLYYPLLQKASNKELSSEPITKCSQQSSGIDKDMIEMEDIQPEGYTNEVSDLSDGGKEEEHKDFAITDLLSFSWQIAKGMVRWLFYM